MIALELRGISRSYGDGASVVHALIDIDPRYPKVGKEQLALLKEMRVQLGGNAADGREAEVAAAGEGATKA